MVAGESFRRKCFPLKVEKLDQYERVALLTSLEFKWLSQAEMPMENSKTVKSW